MNNNRNESSHLLIIFVFVELIYFIIIGSIFSNLLISDNISTNPTAQPIAPITGLPNSIPEAESRTIEETLYSLMLQNANNKQLLNQDAFATINSDSTYYLENQKITLFSAALIVPNLNQSYKLFYGYPDEDNNSFQQFTSILCIKSPSTSCNSSADYTEIDIANSFLPSIQFSRFSIFFNQEDLSRINITPMITSGIDHDTESLYIEEVKSTLNAMGLSPDLFTYHVLTPNDYTFIVK